MSTLISESDIIPTNEIVCIQIYNKFSDKPVFIWRWVDKSKDENMLISSIKNLIKFD